MSVATRVFTGNPRRYGRARTRPQPHTDTMKSNPVGEMNARIHRNVIRLLEGKNHAEVCRKADIRESTLSAQLKKGRYTFEVLAPLSKALGVTIGELADPPVREISARDAPRVLEEIQRVIERAKR